MKAIHILSEIDEESRKALCAFCGPTTLRSIGNGKWRCGVYKKKKDQEWKERNPAHLTHGLTMQEYMAKYYLENKNAFRVSHLKNMYGITPEDYDRMLREQGGVCKLCFGPPAGTGAKNGMYHVDHCHDTMKIRGLLCGKCNVAVGGFRNDPELMRRAADYLES